MIHLEQAPQSIDEATQQAETVAAAREMGLRSLMERAECILGTLSLHAGAPDGRTTTPLHDDSGEDDEQT